MNFFQRKALFGLPAKVGLSADAFDFHAHIDRTLSFGENKRIIKGKLGVVRDAPLDFLGFQASGRQGLVDSYAHSLGLGDYRARRTAPKRLYARSKELDRRYSAERFGRRISASGRVYYEWRANHGDADPSKRL